MNAAAGVGCLGYEGSSPHSRQAGATRPGLIAGALGPSIVSLNTQKFRLLLLGCGLLTKFLPVCHGERVLFIGTRFSNLYISVGTPARGRVVSRSRKLPQKKSQVPVCVFITTCST